MGSAIAATVVAAGASLHRVRVVTVVADPVGRVAMAAAAVMREPVRAVANLPVDPDPVAVPAVPMAAVAAMTLAMEDTATVAAEAATEPEAVVVGTLVEAEEASTTVVEAVAAWQDLALPT